MEFSVAEMFEHESVIGGAGIPGLRLFAVQKNQSESGPIDWPIDLQYPAGWVRSSPETVCGAEYNNDNYNPPHNTTAYCGPHCGPSAVVNSYRRKTWGYFSAVCFVYGRALLRDTGRPQGMLESCWGGTTIEAWSDSSALARCDAKSVRTGSKLYNGMISPLLRSAIRGAIWYQGEANARAYNLYSCQMRALIEGWRAAWSASQPAAAAFQNFTFVLHQLSAYNDQDAQQVPGLRWSQSGAATRWSGLPNVAVSVGIDLADNDSPCGSVHIRNKTAVGERMARAARALAYPLSPGSGAERAAAAAAAAAAATGPYVSGVDYVEGSGYLTVTLSNAAPPLHFISVSGQTTPGHGQGFAVLMAPPDDASGAAAANAAGPVWVNVAAQVESSSSSMIRLLLPPKNSSTAATTSAATATETASETAISSATAAATKNVVMAVRYAWLGTPQSQLLYDSSDISPAATTTGGMHGLPVGPFWANCTTTTTRNRAVADDMTGSPSSSSQPQSPHSMHAFSSSSCKLLPPGQLPGNAPAPPLGPFHPPPPPGPPGPPSPSPPSPPSPIPNQCPRTAKLPTTGACVFHNNTAIAASLQIRKRVSVPLNDFAACCKACIEEEEEEEEEEGKEPMLATSEGSAAVTAVEANTVCTAAHMYHGPKDAGFDFCLLYTTQGDPSKNFVTASSACPNLNVVAVPTK